MGLDDKKNRSINLKFPLAPGTAGAFDVNDETIDAVADDLKILLLTNWGERVMQYDFGANLRAILFEQGFNMQQIEDAIIVAVEKWMPYVAINYVEVGNSETNPSLPPNAVSILVSFSIGSTDLTGDVSVVIRS